MIDLHIGDGSPEDKAARHLEKLLFDAVPDIYENGHLTVCVIANVQCYGQSPQDLDLVVLFVDRRPIPFKSSTGVNVKSGCLTIEVKSHSGGDVWFTGANCFVTYHGTGHNVSRQSEGQKYSLLKYVSEYLREGAPYVNNVIWLNQLPSSQLPKVQSNLVPSDCTWQRFIDLIAELSPVKGQSVDNIKSGRVMFDTVNALTRKLVPGSLDRKRMEAISQRVATTSTIYQEKLGQQLLVFRGRGGTGKTIRLLQLANHLYRDDQSRVLILTYNTALAADISRLLSLLRISDGIGEPGIGVLTVHRLFREWMLALGVLQEGDSSFITNYPILKRDVLELLQGGALYQDDLNAAKQDRSRQLSWDYIFIDECQDWPRDERDILYRLYGYKNFVLADGIDQLVRSGELTDWRERIEKKQSQVVTLRKSLRVKAGLCEAISSVAERLRVSGWDLEPERSLYGGKLVVIAGREYDRALHEQFAQATVEAGNEIIDMLLCVPPSLVRTDENEHRYSTIARNLEQWGYETWDGASYGVRTSYPTSISQHRIVQYDSCRGLEGWSVVCLSLDEFFDYKVAQYTRSEPTAMAFDLNLQARHYASRWLMIPLTRAIHSLVIHLKNPNHPIAGLMESVRREFPETVEWHD